MLKVRDRVIYRPNGRPLVVGTIVKRTNQFDLCWVRWPGMPPRTECQDYLIKVG